jgi:hypothetical protein
MVTGVTRLGVADLRPVRLTVKLTAMPSLADIQTVQTYRDTTHVDLHRTGLLVGRWGGRVHRLRMG